MSKERILSLPCWDSSVELEELSGGITNRNYKVIAPGGNRMARVCEDRRILGIDRRNELVCQGAAAGLGSSRCGGGCVGSQGFAKEAAAASACSRSPDVSKAGQKCFMMF